MAGDKFINPYNFISFPPKKAPAYTDTDRHTGVIVYSVTTKTPLFIPNSSSESAFGESSQVKDHKSYDFFSYTDLSRDGICEGRFHIPVIPGSEMRGVVRNVYETLTDSCMGLLNEEEYPVKRTAEMFKPALLGRGKNGKYVLYNAKSIRIGEKADRDSMPQGFETYRNGTELWYQNLLRNEKNAVKPITRFSMQKGEFNQNGYLLKWGMGVKKARYHLFEKAAGMASNISLSRDEIERKLVKVITSYLDQPVLSKENEVAYKEYKEDLDIFLHGESGEYFPVNYSMPFKGIIYLSPAVFTKEVSYHNIGSLAGDFAPCREIFCPACELFGQVGKDLEYSSGSRIRFTDLYVAEEKKAEEYYFCDKITLQTLAGPKLGNVDFYLEKPGNATFWTYDYHVENGKIIYCPGKLRGRKYYWHQQKVKLPQNIQPTNLNKTVRPVKDGVVFEGKVFFEGISKRQMEQLIWILNNGTEQLGMKLGAGKPLGLGSVFSTVNYVEERKITFTGGQLEYLLEKKSFDEINYESAEFSRSVKEEFYKIAGWGSIPENVQITYPRDITQKDCELKEGYQWFVHNHQTVSGKKMPRNRQDMKIVQELPHILDVDSGLLYTTCKKDSDNQHANSGKTYKNSDNRTKPQYRNRKVSEGFYNNPFAGIKILENGQMEMPDRKGRK